MTSIRLHGSNLHVRCDFADVEKARGIPQRRWLKAAKVWSCRPSLANMDYISHTWPDAEWDDASILEYRQAKDEEQQRHRVLKGEVDLSIIDREIALGAFRKGAKPPWTHQKKALLLARDLAYFAYIMDQGTGKTRTVLDDAAHNYRMKRIDCLIILNKNSVKTNWVTLDQNPEEPDAVDQWLPQDIKHSKALWQSDANKGEVEAFEKTIFEAMHGRGGLVIISLNYEALLMDRCYKVLENLCGYRKVMIVADESTYIGKPGSDRTKQATALRQLCKIARICTGTPIVKSPLKAYSQFAFLNEDILGFGSFYAFKARYCVMGGFEGRQVLRFINLPELSEKIASCSFRVTKGECLDLPPKIYPPKRRVYMSDAQATAYEQMKRTMLATIKGKEVSATIQLTQVMKLQQITGGYVKMDDGTVSEIVKPENNPLIKETLGLIEEAGDQKVIVWAHFHEEIDALVRVLTKHGYRVAQFDGRVPERSRLQIRRDFKNGLYDVLVGNQGAGGMGIDEFKIASVVIYYSNSYDTEARIQSEDRTHRGGSEMHECITYYDLVVPNTVRVKIIQTLRANKSISDEVMRDGLREWI
jgi:hypothetical protein